MRAISQLKRKTSDPIYVQLVAIFRDGLNNIYRNFCESIDSSANKIFAKNVIRPTFLQGIMVPELNQVNKSWWNFCESIES